MPLTTETARNQVRRTIHDKGVGSPASTFDLENDQIDDCVRQALEQYSHDRPLPVLAEFEGTGDRYYPISVLENWVEDESHIIEIEYPAVSQSENKFPTYIDATDDIRIHEELVATERTLYLFFPNHTPADDEMVRVKYTVPIEIGNVRASDLEAFIQLASAYACDRMSGKYARTGGPTMSADTVNYTDRARRWRQLGDQFLSNYWEIIGKGRLGKPLPGTVFIDWDTGNDWDSLFHHSYRR